MTLKNYFASTVCNPAKTRSGDSSFAGEIIINNEPFVILMVADGVSKAPKDWLASPSVVHAVIEYLQQTKAEPDLALFEAVKNANKRLVEGIDNTFGMLTTLTVLLHSLKSYKTWFTSIGDSRLYGYRNSKYEQVSVDDAIHMPYYENGKLKMQGGLPVMVSGLTNALGAKNEIEFELSELNDYTFFILASDGFYNLSGFDGYFRRLFNAVDLEKEVNSINQELPEAISDDASYAIFCPSAFMKITSANLLDDNMEIEMLPKCTLAGFAEQELLKAILEKNNNYIETLLSFMDSRNLLFSKERMISQLDLMIKNKIPGHNLMVKLIRKH